MDRKNLHLRWRESTAVRANVCAIGSAHAAFDEERRATSRPGAIGSFGAGGISGGGIAWRR